MLNLFLILFSKFSKVLGYISEQFFKFREKNFKLGILRISYKKDSSLFFKFTKLFSRDIDILSTFFLVGPYKYQYTSLILLFLRYTNYV